MSPPGPVGLDIPLPGNRARMPPALRAAVYLAGALLWLTGCLWLMLHLGFSQATPFGPLPNPWEPLIMRVHGAAAACALFLLGWVTAAHVGDRWRGIRNRISGFALVSGAGLLGVTGYALYYSTGRVHEGAAIVHECLGVAAIVLLLVHRRRNLARPP